MFALTINVFESHQEIPVILNDSITKLLNYQLSWPKVVN